MSNSINRFFLFTIMPALVGIVCVWALLHQAMPTTNGLAISDAFLSIFSLTLASRILTTILKYFRPARGQEWLLAAWIPIFTISAVFFSWGIQKIYINNDAYLEMLKATFWLRLFITGLTITCIALFTWLQKQNEEQSLSIARWTEIQKLAKEAELNSIRKQLQPHFLFNSLNSIYALIQSNPSLAREMIQHLGDFLRSTLKKDPDKKIPLQEEIEQTRLYLEIEKVRFSQRLTINWDIADTLWKCQMPALILQPLVENAIKFGLYDTKELVEIKIHAQMAENYLNLTLQNPYSPETAATQKGNGFGLDSVRRRLQLLYNRTDLVEINMENSIFSVTVRIPQNPSDIGPQLG